MNCPLGRLLLGSRLFEQIHLKKNITALDIGFGAGFPLTELAMRLGKSCTVYGIDPWEAAIVRTEEKLRHYGITPCANHTGCCRRNSAWRMIQ